MPTSQLSELRATGDSLQMTQRAGVRHCTSPTEGTLTRVAAVDIGQGTRPLGLSPPLLYSV